MEQIDIFLTEYSSWVFVGLFGLTIILLIVTLHRIRRIEKEIRQIADSTKCIAAQTARAVEEREVKQASVKEGACHSAGQEHPEELIDAVLEEVFP